MGKFQFADLPQNIFRHSSYFLHRHSCIEDHKFIPTISGTENLTRNLLFPQNSGNRFQALISGQMSVMIVVFIEEINIHEFYSHELMFLQFYDIDQRFSVFPLVFLINIKILAGIIYVFPGKTLLLQKFTLDRIQIQENIIMLFDMLFINDPDQFFQIFSIRQDFQNSRQDHQFIHDLFKNIPV